MHRARYMWITAFPLAWLVTVTFTAGLQKIFSSDARLGFLSHAAALERAITAGKIPAARLHETHAVIFNERLDAVLCGIFLFLVTVIVVDSLRCWFGLLSGTRSRKTSEAPFIESQIEVQTV